MRVCACKKAGTLLATDARGGQGTRDITVVRQVGGKEAREGTVGRRAGRGAVRWDGLAARHLAIRSAKPAAARDLVADPARRPAGDDWLSID